MTEERIANQRLINEAGDSVPSSQDSITRGVQNLLFQPQHHRRCPTLGGLLRRGCDSSKKNTFVVFDVVQIREHSEEPRTTASCCTWFRSMVASSFMKALLTVPLVFSVTQSGRGGVTAAATAKAILPPETSLLGIPFRTVENRDTRMLRPLARPPFTSLFTARSQCHQVSASMTAHSRTAPLGASPSQIATSSYSLIFAEPRQWPSHAAWSLSTPLPSREPPVAISPGPCCADTACRLLLAEVPKGSDRNAELKLRLQLWEAGEISELIGRALEQQHSGPLRRRKTSSAATNCSTTWQTSMRFDGQGIHQQSRERTLVWSSARLGRLPKELDHSPHPA